MDTCICMDESLRWVPNNHNIVNQLYFNIKKFLNKKPQTKTVTRNELSSHEKIRQNLKCILNEKHQSEIYSNVILYNFENKKHIFFLFKTLTVLWRQQYLLYIHFLTQKWYSSYVVKCTQMYISGQRYFNISIVFFTSVLNQQMLVFLPGRTSMG